MCIKIISTLKLPRYSSEEARVRNKIERESDLNPLDLDVIYFDIKNNFGTTKVTDEVKSYLTQKYPGIKLDSLTLN